MSDRIAIMHDGILEQVGTPSEIYETPQTKFVATFIGETNVFDGCISELVGGLASITVENGEILGQGGGFREGEYITVSIRPEKMRCSETPVEGFTLTAITRDYVYVGSVVKCIAVLPNGNEIKLERLAGEPLPPLDREVYLYWDRADAVLIHSQGEAVFQAIQNVTLG